MILSFFLWSLFVCHFYTTHKRTGTEKKEEEEENTHDNTKLKGFMNKANTLSSSGMCADLKGRIEMIFLSCSRLDEF